MAASTSEKRAAGRKRMFGSKPNRIGSFAMVQPQRGRVSTAALKKIKDGSPDRVSQADDEWQRLAYEYFDLIGEVGYVYDLKANLVARCELKPQVLNDEDEWVDDEDERALRVMSAFVGPQGGQAELKRRGALHLGIAGETMLVGTTALDDFGQNLGIFWEFLSTEEIKIEAGAKGKVKRRAEGNQFIDLGPDVYVARLWRSHPRFSGLSVSAMKRVLQVSKELVLLSQYVEAIAKTKLSANILFVPDELSFASEDSEDTDVDGEDGDDDGIDPFTRQILEHMSAPVEDRTSAASLVPLILRGPADLGEKVKIIELARQLDEWAKELREEALDRLAAGLDIPKETMTGKSTLSGLGGGSVAESVDADLIARHVIPDGELFADFVTYAYHRPMLEAFEDMSPEEVARRRIVFDASPIAARNDEASSARTLHEIDPTVLKTERLRKAAGFDDADAPEDEEVAMRRMWHLLKTNPSAVGPVIGPVLLPDLDWTKMAAPGPADGTAPPGGSSQQGEPQYAMLLERLATAADAALERAFERAGARIVTHCQKDPSLKDRTRAVPKVRACTLVTRDELARMKLTPEMLLAEAWTSFSSKAREWFRDYLEGQGLDHLTADDRAALATSQLERDLDALAKDYLFRGLPAARNGLRVPRELVERALAGQTLTAVP